MVGEDRHQIITRVNNVYVMLKVINAIEERGVRGLKVWQEVLSLKRGKSML